MLSVYEPMLLLIVAQWSTRWALVAWSVASASIGVICLAASLFGWLLAPRRSAVQPSVK